MKQKSSKRNINKKDWRYEYSDEWKGDIEEIKKRLKKLRTLSLEVGIHSEFLTLWMDEKYGNTRR